MFKINFILYYLFATMCSMFRSVCANEFGGVGVNAPAMLPLQSQKIGYDSELRMKSLLQSIYTDLKGIYNTETKKTTNGIYIQIDDATLSDSAVGRITMKLHLRATGVFGNAIAIGNEELPTTKGGLVFRNNCRKVVATPKYGVRKLEQDYLGLYKQHVDDLGPWNQEEEDLEIHQALVETHGETLRHGDTAAICIPNWNANVFIAGLPFNGAHPVYSTNPAIYTQRIANAVLASGAGSFAPIVNQTLNMPNLSNLSNFAVARRIERLNIPGLPGGKGFLLTISELDAVYLGDPVWSARNLGSQYIQFNALNEKVQNWTGVLGAYKDMLISVDMRLATILFAGSNAPYSMTAGYVWHGDTDLRNRANPFTRNACILHGKAPIYKWYPEKIHFINQLDDYGAIEGVGTACVRGIGHMLYDQQVPVAGSHEQFGSVMSLTSMPDYV